MEINRAEKTIKITQNTGIAFSVSFLLLLAGALATATMWVANMQNRVEAISSSVKESRSDIDQLKSESTITQIKFTEIQTQLKSIDATLVEIKDALR